MHYKEHGIVNGVPDRSHSGLFLCAGIDKQDARIMKDSQAFSNRTPCFRRFSFALSLFQTKTSSFSLKYTSNCAVYIPCVYSSQYDI